MDAPRLTSALTRWCVTLRSGRSLDIGAHAAAEQDGYLVFTALAHGTPNFEIVLAVVPLDDVDDWEGGWTFDGTFPRIER